MPDQEIDEREEALTLLIVAWPDIEDKLLGDDRYADLADAVKRAFRVEADVDRSGVITTYLLRVLRWRLSADDYLPAPPPPAAPALPPPEPPPPESPGPCARRR